MIDVYELIKACRSSQPSQKAQLLLRDTRPDEAAQVLGEFNLIHHFQRGPASADSEETELKWDSVRRAIADRAFGPAL